jgi:uncharacterized protein
MNGANRDADPGVAVITSATGPYGFAIARRCVHHGFALLMASPAPPVFALAEALREDGARVAAVRADVATPSGVIEVYEAARDLPLAALVINIEFRGGFAFLDQNFRFVRRGIDSTLNGALELTHKLGRKMRQRMTGRILITGSPAGGGPHRAVEAGSRSFLRGFSTVLAHELRGVGVSVTCFLPDASPDAPEEGTPPSLPKAGIDEAHDVVALANAAVDAMMLQGVAVPHGRDSLSGDAPSPPPGRVDTFVVMP